MADAAANATVDAAERRKYISRYLRQGQTQKNKMLRTLANRRKTNKMMMMAAAVAAMATATATATATGETQGRQATTSNEIAATA